MKSQKPKLSNALTNRVIDLHNQGYTDDFLPIKEQKVKCIQNSEDFSFDDLNIQVIDQCFDQLSNSYKYIHTIETINGNKGLLFADVALADAEAVH